jgi:hypothetical protein
MRLAMPTNVPEREDKPLSSLVKISVCAAYLAIFIAALAVAAYDTRVAIWLVEAANSEVNQSGFDNDPPARQAVIAGFRSPGVDPR